MNGRLDVTVLIPAHNEELRLGTALEDVLAQSLVPLEILVIDDGSTDRTAEVAARYPGVRVIAGSGAGISAARNLGLRAARGEWIAFLDADDRWQPERLAELARAVAAAPDVAFCFSDYVVTEHGRPNAPSNLARTSQFRALTRARVAAGIDRIERTELASALAVGNFLGTSTVSIRTSLACRPELAFDEALPERTAAYQLSEDVEWYLRVLRETDAVVIERVLTAYDRRPGSAAAAHGRVRYGDVKLGERVARTPERYAPGAAAAFVRLRRSHQRHAASIHARATNFAAAASILREALRERFEVRDAVALALLRCCDNALGRGAVRASRSLWRARRSAR